MTAPSQPAWAPSRRAFLTSLAGSAFGAGLAAAGDEAQPQPPRTPVIDTHMHVWSDDPARFPFAHPYEPAFQPPKVAGTLAMLRDEMDRSGVTHCVLVQVIYHGWDNRYVAHGLKAHPGRFRGQGLIDPTDPRA